MDVLLFWILVLFLVIAVFSWPTWPYTRERPFYRQPGARRYGPSGLALLIVLLLLFLFWGAIWWPWAAHPAM